MPASPDLSSSDMPFANSSLSNSALPTPSALVEVLSPASSVIARSAVSALRSSKIRDVANAGMGLPDVLPFWFGESDRATPAMITEAARAALAEGRTYYTHNLGNAALREALAEYVTGLHGATESAQIAVTSGGVSALMLAVQLLAGPGDRVVAVTPLWPNIVEMPKIVGASVETVSLDFGEHGWVLDIDKLIAALHPGTRLLIVNSPNNPTGWVMPRVQQERLLDHCRKHEIWILADEVYERLYYGCADPGDPADGRKVAPSFLDIASRDERVIVVNSFSKSWLMTGWRLGWAVLPARLMEDWGKLAEYNTSCAPDFVQAAGLVAVREGENVARTLQADLHVRRDHLLTALSTIPGVDARASEGAMYVFFRVAGFSDSLWLCKDLVHKARLGLAPGIAFGDEGEGYVRWCYASDLPRLDDGVQRLRAYVLDQGPQSVSSGFTQH